MKIPFIQFQADQRVPEEGALPIHSPADLKDLVKIDPPQVLLIKDEYLDDLRTFGDAILDRGQKDARKPLAFYLISKKRDRVPLIFCHFSSIGKLQNSIAKFLKKAVAARGFGTFVVSVNSEMFDAIRGHYLNTQGTGAIQKKATPLFVETQVDRQSGDPSVGSSQPQDIADLIDFTVPESLKKRYLGNSPEMAMVRKMIIAAATSYGSLKDPTPVLILGPSGTGKELVARSIHHYSGCKGPFIAVNCGAIARELFESELFGHKKGSFTGAVEDKTGLWQTAAGGTLFLDEVGDLLPEHQVKVLRALADKKIRRVGDNAEIPVNPRIVAATNRDLFFMVRENLFREDLYYRLRGIMIRTPALRDCLDDIPGMANNFWKKICEDPDAVLPEPVLRGLKSYPWPGNARHIKSVLRQLRTLFPNKALEARHLHYVMALEDSMPCDTRPQPEGKEIKPHLAKCLRHLRRVDEAVHASMTMLAPYLRTSGLVGEKLAYVKTEVQHHLNEMEWLLQNPQLFGSYQTFSIVSRLKGKLTFFDSLLAEGYDQAREYWEKEIKEDFDHVLNSVFSEFENVLDQA